MDKIRFSIKITQCLAFVALLATSFFCVSNQIKSFWDGKTVMIESKRSLSVNDMPTLTICFGTIVKLKYGQDLRIMVQIPTTASSHELKLGFTQIEERLIHLKQFHMHPRRARDCFVLNFRFKDKHLTDSVKVHKLWDNFFAFGLFKISFMTTDIVRKPAILVTSDKNSYGATMSHWYDGVVEPIRVNFRKYYGLQITQTREYRYLKGTCMDRSFVECTASKLSECNSCRENGQYCSPYSLPRGRDFEDLEVCQTNSTYLECNQEFAEKTWLQCKSQKACRMTEYSMNEYNDLDLKDKKVVEEELKLYDIDITDNHTKLILDEPENSFMFFIAFDHPDASRGDEKLLVRILEEHLWWTGIDLVGMIGGQMGLFLGFSFMGSIAWLLNAIGECCATHFNQKIE